jgi:ribonuclease E
MPNKMLIDATHPEETRVVVLRGNRVEEFDFESANRKQLRGNIYLAKVTRVEPSLQAAFVDYGGNRHGFLAFSEIHPDYYQIPVADRQALIEAEERAHRDDEAEHERRRGRGGRGGGRHRNRGSQRRDETLHGEAPVSESSQPMDGDTSATEHVAHENAEIQAGENMQGDMPSSDHSPDHLAEGSSAEHSHDDGHDHGHDDHDHAGHDHDGGAHEHEHDAPQDVSPNEAPSSDAPIGEYADAPQTTGEVGDSTAQHADQAGGEHSEEDAVESVGGADAMEEAQERAPRVRPRQYKIQEVIKRRQVMLVQVVKEERGSKGAALTTYLSLAGRYCVLMPNTSRGGGISRKITSSEDRNRLKEIAQDLEVPDGMGVILRTAGASRTKVEVKRDFEYLMRLWETVRDLTLKSTAPKLVYEEGSLTKRSIRDLYNKDIDEIIVAGEQGYKDAKEFMRMLMPSHAKNVKLYRDTQPVFTRFGIESQLDAMFTPTVQLRSGGYIVINQTEALVAIDVNSGRATREHHIEDTALKTNSEAAEEVARQLRLRDLAGLIVIDFIDMDEGRNNRAVERRMKEALRHDRARIQVGRISHFGLLEMSRQRIRTSVLESSTEKCPVCGGSGHVRSVSSVTLALLRSIEEMLIKGATHNLIVRTRPEVALYILNQKRGHLRMLEERFRITITVNADATVVGAQSFIVDRGEQVHTPEAARQLALAAQPEQMSIIEDDEADADAAAEAEAGSDEDDDEIAGETYGDSEPAAEPETGDAPEHDAEPMQVHSDQPREGGDGDGGHRRKRRRRGGRGRGRNGEGREPRDGGFNQQPVAEHAASPEDFEPGEGASDSFAQPQGQDSQTGAQHGGAPGEGQEGHDGPRRRRRGRRGGRRNRGRNGDNGFAAHDANGGQNGQQGQPDLGHQPVERNIDAAAYTPPPTDTPRAEPERYDAPSAQAAPDTGAPRRRSTIRESASFSPDRSSAPASTPVPVISSTATDEPAQPKRGWWGKRLLGGKD